MFKSLMLSCALFSTVSFAQEANMVRINYANLDSFDVVQGDCIEDAGTFSVMNTLKIKKVNGLTYNYSKKEQGYGACSWAFDAADKTKTELSDKMFSLLWGDLEVVTVGNDNACFREVLNLTLVPKTNTIKSMAFKKLPIKCP